MRLAFMIIFVVLCAIIDGLRQLSKRSIKGVLIFTSSGQLIIFALLVLALVFAWFDK